MKNKTKWLLQDVGIAMVNMAANFQTVKMLRLPYMNFGVLAHTKQITNLENVLLHPEEKFIIRGGTKMLSLLDNIGNLSELNPDLTPEQIKHSAQHINQLRAGIFYDEQSFDQAYYSQLDLPLLNKKCELYAIKDNLALTFTEDLFVKPSRDQKAFDAGILKAGQTVQDFITNQPHQKMYMDEQLLVAPLQNLQSEYRFFVVNREVITGSRYRLNKLGSLSAIIPDMLMGAAQEYAQLYQPHDIFTIDLAITDKGIKIVEYNCWNASGLYNSDVEKLFQVVNDYVINKPEIAPTSMISKKLKA